MSVLKIVPDNKIQKQHKLLDELHAHPYFRSFNPRIYPLYEERHYQPIEYLEQVGIEKIAEIVQHNYSLQEVAQMLDISSTTMRKWVQRNRAYSLEIEEAQKWGADNYAYRSIRVIENSPTVPEIFAKNKAIAEGYRWMAERHNKAVYGTKTIKHEGNIGTTVQYNIQINGMQPASLKTVEAIDAPPDTLTEDQILAITQLPSLDFSQEEDEQGSSDGEEE